MKIGTVKMSDIAGHPTQRMDAEYWLDRQARGLPVDPELFKRTAPRWNCVDFPGEGMHYTPGRDGSCAWCGATREQIAAERQASDG